MDFVVQVLHHDLLLVGLDIVKLFVQKSLAVRDPTDYLIECEVALFLEFFNLFL